jgi:prophage regulatory protein
MGEPIRIVPGDRLLRLREVEAKTGIGSTTIYRFMPEGKFPYPVRLGEGSVRWRESDIDRWIAELPSAAPEDRASAA